MVADEERRVRGPVAFLRVGDLDVPFHLAVSRVERDQMRVGRGEEDRVLVDRDAPMADVEAGVVRIAVVPHLARRSRVDRPELIGRADVEHAVDDDRRRFDRGALSGLKRPRQRQLR